MSRVRLGHKGQQVNRVWQERKDHRERKDPLVRPGLQALQDPQDLRVKRLSLTRKSWNR